MAVLKRVLKKAFDLIFSPKRSETKEEKKSPPKTSDEAAGKSHPWRLCPIGQHWVRAHPLTVPASETRPERVTTRRGHCRVNKSKTEFYMAEELTEIAERYFGELASDPQMMPTPDTLGFPNGNEYDLLIAGWTKFWNEILEPKDPLTPDFVKALIATESSFLLPRDQHSRDGAARGLIQVTENTRKILQNLKGELQDHHIELTPEESREPTTNIAAGIRWLHHKKRLAERRLKRPITWEEAGAEYKGIFPQLGKVKKSDQIMKDLRKLHKRLKDQRKQ
ncbi:MAG TPA: transglycosylase SLT domain-containing protein [Pseudobdellovibrionaceae bacterium]|nr:transglycosylase SLT domain-containing protein [Pseudobdellovibrionaceae bacterium]